MRDNDQSADKQKKEVIKTSNIIIEGHLFKFHNLTIQISNISMMNVVNAEVPEFPWKKVGIAVLLSIVAAAESGGAIIALIALAAAVFWGYTWYKEKTENKNSAYLHLVLNSGQAYFIYCRDKNFLYKFRNLFNEIFANGGKEGVSYNFNLNKCTFSDHSSVMRE